ncbi:MerR family transcriptional regulator [Lacrimispora sp. AGF001]|uniref:MerR family transcriptional regulator n=1 Tax=Lacrimispora sp. AGF001 TaxID=3401631 RepID=UPI003B429B8F|nr:MerR family transcriptional regulator [Paenibacillaceae bacterium]
MLKIGDFSKLSRISIRMLRHYDEIGLMTPRSTDHFTGYRYYSEDQLLKAVRINSLKDMGFSLAAIGELLKSYDDPGELAKFLEVRRVEVLEEMKESGQRLKLLDAAIQRLRKDVLAMNYSVALKTMPQRYVASVREIIPAYNQEGLLWKRLGEETHDRNLQMCDPAYSLAVFHDRDFRDGDVDVEIQISVKGTYENTEHVVFKTVPEVEIASAVYKGSYDQITDVNLEVANWVRDNEYEFNGPMFCIYHVSPAQSQNPEELVTEVCYPVKKI